MIKINHNVRIIKLDLLNEGYDMKLFNTGLIDAIWEITKGNYPEWTANQQNIENVSDIERKEDVEYCENSKDGIKEQGNPY